jgi:Mitochondrial small ribosomal subunit Rsm22
VFAHFLVPRHAIPAPPPASGAAAHGPVHERGRCCGHQRQRPRCCHGPATRSAGCLQSVQTSGLTMQAQLERIERELRSHGTLQSTSTTGTSANITQTIKAPSMEDAAVAQLAARAEELRRVATGAHVVAPCSHDGACPMDKAANHGWCHFRQRFERTFLHRMYASPPDRPRLCHIHIRHASRTFGRTCPRPFGSRPVCTMWPRSALVSSSIHAVVVIDDRPACISVYSRASMSCLRDTTLPAHRFVCRCADASSILVRSELQRIGNMSATLMSSCAAAPGRLRPLMC